MAKIFQKRQKFEPITIVLEEEVEADLLWCLLNLSGDEIQKICSLLAGIEREVDVVADVKYRLWESLDRVYAPRNYVEEE